MLQTIPPLSDTDRLSWLRLIRSENVGPVTFNQLLQRFGTPARALDALPELARRGGRSRAIKICSSLQAEREIEAARRLGARLLCACEPEFPPLLAAIDSAPPVIYVLGHVHLLVKPAVALVGARNASIAARNFGRKISMDLGQAGFTIVSGLARGLDTAAHEGSLATGTIAVMAGGVDIIYPPENSALHAAIRAEGAVVSEMPPGTEPQARHFPRRNRIISGLAQGVLVVEATARSGSLITARLAAEQGRDVMAVPGSPLDPRSEGPNGLIKDGAALIRGVEDVLDVLATPPGNRMNERQGSLFSPPPPSMPSKNDLDIARNSVIESLGATAVTVDEIIRQCQLSPSVVSMVLLELELAGRLERHHGNRVSSLPEA